MIRKMVENAFLVLEDGTIFKGTSMGAKGEAVGEVVFNTCTASYQDILIDPTYFGQIVAQTYPLVGNRGMSGDMGASAITAKGYIAREWCDTPSDIRGGITLDEYLRNKGIVGICDIDTRQLTRKLRNKSYFKGAIVNSLDDVDDLMKRVKDYTIHGAISKVSIKESRTYHAVNSQFTLVAVDFGFPRDMINAFLKRDCSVVVVPFNTKPEEILSYKPDGLIFPDGPGDPDDNPLLIDHIKDLIKHQIPTIGIGLGHQIIAIAAGGTIHKMDKGHRGSNQPVRICGTQKVMVTTQNHSYDILDGSLKDDVAKVLMRNVNDNSVEGILYSSYKCITTQFAPLEYGNYSDSSWIYDDFISMIERS